MSGTIRATANDILNQVGAEVGLTPVADPWGSSNQAFQQMRYLLNTAGEELSQLFKWDFLSDEWVIATTGAGVYDTPDDFLYIVNQTGWNRTEDEPVYGPVTPQEWQHLKSSGIGVTDSLFFRLSEDQLWFYPTDTAGQVIAFEYIKRTWVEDSENPGAYIDKVVTGGDIPLFNRTLIGRMLKVKWLEAKGFDTTKAQADLNQSFALLAARNKGAPILNISGNGRGVRLLNANQNVSDTGYGS